MRQRTGHLHQELLGGLGPLAPRLGHESTEAAGRKRELKDAGRLGQRSIDVGHLLGEHLRLIERGVRRRLENREHHALVFAGRELPLREHVERHHQDGHDHPEDENDRPVAKRTGQRSRVGVAQAVESAVDPAGEAALALSGAQKLRTHHRRQRERDDSGHDDRARERERKLTEQRAGQAALDTHRGIHRSQRDGHRDDRADQFPGGVDGRPEGRLAAMDVALDVLHHHDRVVHDEADREDDGEERQQVDREACRQHQEHGAHERDRDRDNGDEDRAQRSEEEEDHDDHDQQRLGEGGEDLVDGVFDVRRRVVGDARLHPSRHLRTG